MKYKRILLKLSGEALMGDRQYGIDPQRLAEYAEDIKTIIELGVEVAIVIGGQPSALDQLIGDATHGRNDHHQVIPMGLLLLYNVGGLLNGSCSAD